MWQKLKLCGKGVTQDTRGHHQEMIFQFGLCFLQIGHSLMSYDKNVSFLVGRRLQGRTQKDDVFLCRLVK